MFGSYRGHWQHRARTRRTLRRTIVIAALALGTVASAGPASADHILAHTLSVANCLPGNALCARITMEIRYHPADAGGQYTLRTNARASALLVPGTLEARQGIQLLDPGPDQPSNLTLRCGWSVLGSGCSLSFPALETATFPAGACIITRFDLAATARAIDDPVFRLLPVSARVTRDLRMCWDGTVTVV